MDIAPIIEQYYPDFMARYQQVAFPDHLKVLDAMVRCRTKDCGELYVHCPGCGHAQWRPLSCGRRSCPQCQNHEARLSISGNVPGEWIVDCTHAGKGISALKYLSRYLYRGVISDEKYHFKSEWPNHLSIH